MAPKLLQLGNWVAQKTSEEDIYFAYVPTLIEGLGKIKDPESTRLLTRFANDTKAWEYVQIEALKELLNRGVQAPKAIETLAESKYWRKSLFDALNEHNQISMFPARFANQRAMAESYLEAALEDEYPDTLLFHAEKILPYMGGNYRFFVFKAGFKTDDGMEYYPAVAGPFLQNRKELLLADEAWDVSYVLSEKFSKKMLDKQIAEHLKEMEGYLKEEQE